MKKPVICLLPILLALFLGGCSSVRDATRTSIAKLLTVTPSWKVLDKTPENSLTPLPTGGLSSTPVIPTLTPSPFITPTLLVPAEAKLEINCLKLNLVNITDLHLKGKIVLGDPAVGTIKLLDLVTGTISTSINKDRSMLPPLAVSPDQQWLIYENFVGKSPDDKEIILLDAEGNQRKVIPWQSSWDSIAGWYDKDWLWLDQKGNGMVGLTLFNPFNGQTRQLRHDYPSIYLPPPYLYFWDGFSVSGTVYDPTISRVVYASSSSGTNLVLWDIENWRKIADISTEIGTFGPLWSPNGEKFYMNKAVTKEKRIQDRSTELFSVSRDGDIKPLTNLASYYKDIKIVNASLSPDGHLIAFIANTGKNDKYPISYNETDDYSDRLFIYNTDTQKVTNLCLPSRTEIRPIWSLDNRYLLVIDSGTNSKEYIYLVDLIDRSGFLISDGSEFPYGWLNSPE